MTLRNLTLALVLQLILCAPLSAQTSPLSQPVPGVPKAPGSGLKVLKTAKSFLGTPYRWGGVTSRGFDCSGYVQSVLKKHGFTVPRLADVQYAKSNKVRYKDLKPGDMVFFSTYLPGASHCGFYLGNGEFIHASSAGKQVMISQMRNGYYRNRFVGGGRPNGWVANDV